MVCSRYIGAHVYRLYGPPMNIFIRGILFNDMQTRLRALCRALQQVPSAPTLKMRLSIWFWNFLCLLPFGGGSVASHLSPLDSAHGVYSGSQTPPSLAWNTYGCILYLSNLLTQNIIL